MLYSFVRPLALLATVALTMASAGTTYTQPIKRQQVAEPIRGVNLGGGFVLEPWITPSLFEQWANVPSTPVVDEWSYCEALGRSECLRRLRQHWATWIQETDIYTLATMHINTLRIPIGYWALVADSTTPYVQGQIPYLERILGWAQKYRMRVILDLHGTPGSQNGFDNSGRRGNITWSKRHSDIPKTLDALDVLARIANKFPLTVVGIQAVNEPANWGVPKSTIAHFYQMAHRRVRGIAPQVNLVFHDAFLPDSEWESIVPHNLTDSILDTHIYHVFVEDQLRLTEEGHISQACDSGNTIRRSNARVRTICGEFSLATTDCARWLNGFQRGARWDGSYLTTKSITPGGSCYGAEDMRLWDSQRRAFMQRFAMAQIQSYEKGSGWIFWNFKAENADAWDFIKLSRAGIIPNPPIGSTFGICPA